MDPYAVDLEACRGRQQRLLDAIEPTGAELILLSRRESVQWATGAFVKAPFVPIACLRSDGHMTLVMPERQIAERTAADEVVGYEAKWHSTNRDEQLIASSSVVRDKIKSVPKQIACEFEAFPPQLLLEWNATLVEIDSVIFELRRRKGPDELRMLRRANEANRAMYEHAREIVQPG